ncbi:hypothetical protein LQ327_24370 [Actinomycetospora endophytica]|uniref:Uncharacterized protein n=1 Tax=Actinomycetospora endophytica TaxID=2291215 RepID=A0ABS8PE07_9PSEU|nr:hypothetical protein [Actinomycetospora endophytica]MCD2196514.1 hypothetical protein [Actinomycetospora endophytica]
MDDRDDALSVLIMVTGPVALVVSTGWQVAWLVLLAVFAVLRRSGTRWRGTPAPTAPPPDPAGA